ncbi:hypothetical protein [Streptomyces sp. NPDC018055]|uniref:hypothetical protein n=1 Tax=Streptomyces sp. NPDC018055 TaxID=3365038 RepID=UPI0037AA6987
MTQHSATSFFRHTAAAGENSSGFDHGDRTDAGKKWWAGYTDGKKVTRGRTMATLTWDVPEQVSSSIHRGITLPLTPEDHAHVHDRNIPARKRALHVLNLATARGSLGRHWSTDEDTAHHFSHTGANDLADHPHLLSVTLHAHAPQPHHIERDPAELGKMGVEGHLVENEIPLTRGASVRIHGLHWQDTRDSTNSHSFSAGEGNKGIERRAATEITLLARLQDGDDIPSGYLNPHGHHVKVKVGGQDNVELVPRHEVERYASQETTREHTQEVGEHVITSGEMEPLILHYHPKTGEAYLGEGNHRLRAARTLQMDRVPLRVTRNNYGLPGPGVKTPQDHPAIAAGTHVPYDIKPSDIGLGTGQHKTAAAEKPCPCCGGTGEHDTGSECYHCDGGRTVPADSPDDAACEGRSDTPVPNNTQPYQHEHDWLPHGHFFAPGKKDLDPRLFDGDRMHPEIRQHLLSLLNSFWAPKYGDTWQSWARVYLAGSEASHFYGNDDLDVLIGIDYDAARHHVDAFTGEPDGALDTKLTDELRSGLNDDHRMLPGPDGDVGPFESTFYVNPGSYDIRVIKPYAAYDITRDEWAVRPVEVPDDFGPEKLPESTWDVFDALKTLIKAVGELPAGVREREGAALYDYLHTDRHSAFGPDGTGLYDPANATWKALDKAPGAPLQQLIDWKHAHDGATATDQENAA